MSTSYVTLPNYRPISGFGSYNGWYGSTSVQVPTDRFEGLRWIFAIAVGSPRTDINKPSSATYVAFTPPPGVTLIASDNSNLNLQIFVYEKVFTSQEIISGTLPSFYYFNLPTNTYARFAQASWTYDTFADYNRDGALLVSVASAQSTIGQSTNGSASGSVETALVNAAVFSVGSSAASGGAPLAKVNGVFVPATFTPGEVESLAISTSVIESTYTPQNSFWAVTEFQFGPTPDIVGIVQYSRPAIKTTGQANNAELATLGTTTNTNQGTTDALTVSKTGTATVVTTNSSPVVGGQSYRATTTSSTDSATLTAVAPSWNYPAGSLRFSVRGLAPNTTILSEPYDSQGGGDTQIAVNSAGNLIIGSDTGIIVNSGTTYTIDMWFRGISVNSTTSFHSILMRARVYDHSVSTQNPVATKAWSLSRGNQYSVPFKFAIGPSASVGDLWIDDVITRGAPGFVGPPGLTGQVAATAGLTGVARKVSVTTGSLPISAGVAGSVDIHWYGTQTPDVYDTAARGYNNVFAKFSTSSPGLWCAGARYYKAGPEYDGSQIVAGLWQIKSGVTRGVLLATGKRVQSSSDPIGWVGISWDQPIPTAIDPSASYVLELYFPPVGSNYTPFAYLNGAGSLVADGGLVTGTPSFKDSKGPYGLLGPDNGPGFSANGTLPSSWRAMIDVSLKSVKTAAASHLSWLDRVVISSASPSPVTINADYGDVLLAFCFTISSTPSMPGWSIIKSGTNFAVMTTNAIAGTNTISAPLNMFSGMVVYRLPAGTVLFNDVSYVSTPSSPSSDLVPFDVPLSGKPFVNTIFVGAIASGSSQFPTYIGWSGDISPDYVIDDEQASGMPSISVGVADRFYGSSARVSGTMLGFGQYNQMDVVAVVANVATSWTPLPISVGLTGVARTVLKTTGVLPVQIGLSHVAPSYLYVGANPSVDLSRPYLSKTMGRDIVITQTGYVSTAGRYYFDPTKFGSKPPVSLGLWRVETGELLTYVTVSDTITTAGWRTVAWPEPVQLESGATYRISTLMVPQQDITNRMTVYPAGTSDIVGSVMTGPLSGSFYDSDDRGLYFNKSIQPTTSPFDPDTWHSSQTNIFVSNSGQIYLYVSSTIDNNTTPPSYRVREKILLLNPTTLAWDTLIVNEFGPNMASPKVTFNPNTGILYIIYGLTIRTYSIATNQFGTLPALSFESNNEFTFSCVGVSPSGSLLAVKPSGVFLLPNGGDSWITMMNDTDSPLVISPGSAPRAMAISFKKNDPPYGSTMVAFIKMDPGSVPNGVYREDIWSYNWDDNNPSSYLGWARYVNRHDRGLAHPDYLSLFASRNGTPFIYGAETISGTYDKLLKTAISTQEVSYNLNPSTMAYSGNYITNDHGTSEDVYAHPGSVQWDDAIPPVIMFKDAPAPSMELPSTPVSGVALAADIETRIAVSVPPIRPWLNKTESPKVVANTDSSISVNYQSPTSGSLMMMVVRSANPNISISGWDLVANDLLASDSVSVYTRTAIAGEAGLATITQAGDTTSDSVGVIVYEFPAGSSLVNSAIGSGGTATLSLGGTFAVISIGSYPEKVAPGYYNINWLGSLSKQSTSMAALSAGSASTSPISVGYQENFVGSIDAVSALVSDGSSPHVISLAIFVPTSVAGSLIDVGIRGSAWSVLSTKGYAIIGVGLVGVARTVAKTSGSIGATINISAKPVTVVKASGSVGATSGLSGSISVPVYLNSGSLSVAISTTGSAILGGVTAGATPALVALQSTSYTVAKSAGAAGANVGLAASAFIVTFASGTLPAGISIGGSARTVAYASGAVGADAALATSNIKSTQLNMGYAPVKAGLTGVAKTIVATSATLPFLVSVAGQGAQLFTTSGELPVVCRLRASYYLVREAAQIKSSSATSFYDGDGSATSYLASGEASA